MSKDRTAVKGLGEIALRVNDLDTMQEFYEEVIGLELMKRFPKAVFFRVADGVGGHPQVLALFDRSEKPEGVSQERSTLDHVAFEIDLASYESEKTRLERHGLSVETVVFEWTGWRSLFVSDPEGNTVELVCFDPNAYKP